MLGLALMAPVTAVVAVASLAAFAGVVLQAR